MTTNSTTASMQVDVSNRESCKGQVTKQFNTHDAVKPTFHYLFNAGKKTFSFPFFHNVRKEECRQESMEEMHEIFRDGNFTVIDGLIVLAPKEQRCKGEMMKLSNFKKNLFT